MCSLRSPPDLDGHAEPLPERRAEELLVAEAELLLTHAVQPHLWGGIGTWR